MKTEAYFVTHLEDNVIDIPSHLGFRGIEYDTAGRDVPKRKLLFVNNFFRRHTFGFSTKQDSMRREAKGTVSSDGWEET